MNNKLRAWNIDKKKMHFPTDDDWNVTRMQAGIGKEELFAYEIPPDGQEAGRLKPLWFTGFNDREGTEIYQGDVVEFEVAYETDSVLDEVFKVKGIVEWLDNGGKWIVNLAQSRAEYYLLKLGVFEDLSYRVDKMKVLGNRYESEELISEYE